MRKLHLASLGIILVGGILMLEPIFGASMITADRGVSISVGDEETALLGYDHVEDLGELDRGDEETEIAVLFNNLDDDMEIYAADLELEITTEEGENVESDVLNLEFDDTAQNPVDFSDEVGLLISCNRERNVGESDVSVEITNAQSTGGTVSISGVSFTTSVNIQCDGGGQPIGSGEIRAHDVYEDTQSFEIRTSEQGNMDQATIDFSSVDFIDYSDAEVEAANGIDPELDPENQVITFDDDPDDQQTEITLTNIEVEESGSAVVEFTEERRGPAGSSDSDRFHAYR